MANGWGAGKVRRRVRPGHADLRWAAMIWSISAGLLCVNSVTYPFLALLQHRGMSTTWSLCGDNVIVAERQPWLAIDPKPLPAEREFSLAPVIRSFEFGHLRAEVVKRGR